MSQLPRFFSLLLPYPHPYSPPEVLLGSTYLHAFSFFHLALTTVVYDFLVLIYLLDFWLPEHSVPYTAFELLTPPCLVDSDLMLCFDLLFLVLHPHSNSGLLTEASALDIGCQVLPQDCLSLVLIPFPLALDLPQHSWSWLPLLPTWPTAIYISQSWQSRRPFSSPDAQPLPKTTKDRSLYFEAISAQFHELLGGGHRMWPFSLVGQYCHLPNGK